MILTQRNAKVKLFLIIIYIPLLLNAIDHFDLYKKIDNEYMKTKDKDITHENLLDMSSEDIILSINKTYNELKKTIKPKDEDRENKVIETIGSIMINTTSAIFIGTDILRAIELENNGEYSKALEQYNKSIEKIEKMPDTNYSILLQQPCDTMILDELKQECIKDKQTFQTMQNTKYNLLINSYRRKSLILLEYYDSDEASIYINKAILLFQKSKNKDFTLLSHLYNTKTDILIHKGIYNKALEYAQKSLNINKLYNLPKNSLTNADAYHDISAIYQFWFGEYRLDKDIDIALENENKSLKIYLQDKSINSSINVGISYNSLAMIYDSKHNYKKSIELYKKSLGIMLKYIPNNALRISGIYANMAVAYDNQEKYIKALEYHDKNIKLRLDKIKDNPYHLSLAYHSKATTLYSQKNYKEAIYFYQKSLNIGSKTQFKYILMQTYGSLGLSYFYNFNYQEGYNYILKSFKLFLERRERDFLHINNTRKKELLKVSHIKIIDLFNISYKYKSQNEKNVTIDILTQWINYKGTISEGLNLLTMLYKTSDEETKKDIDRLKELSVSLSSLYQGIQKNNTKQIKYIEKDINQLQIKLNKNIKEFREFNNLKNISIADISKTLKDDELYIDFAKTDKNYYIFTLDKSNHITFEQISKEDTKLLNQKIEEFRKNNKNKATKSIKETQKTLSSIYTILNKYINFKSKKSLIISPDGLLNFLPFEALYDGDKYLVESVNISYIPSGRELVRQSRREQTKSKTDGVVIFGNIDYGLNDDTTSNKKSLNLMHYLPQLTSSKEEIDTLYKLYPKAKIYQDKMATVENLFKIKSPKILHLSTHGKFVDDKNTTNPMQQTILAFSDANYAILEKDYRGIATALKLSSLELANTELVFLSACETGLGTIQTAEGVQGLPKAFIQAGAKNIIMSLWQVDDSKTTELTRYFYENVKGGMDYKEALREAKLKMIEMHPYYWSGFVFSGSGI